jgi:micrococcal nuclease
MRSRHLIGLFAILYLASLACGGDGVTPTLSETAVPFPGTTNTPALVSPAQGEQATVTHVVDGDTIDVALGGETYRVRYIGMDTPERGDFFFQEATEANRALVEDQRVILVKDVSETDRFGRLLRYIYLEDGTFVNAELVRQGYAVIATFPPDVRHQELFLELEREARAASRGLWAQPADNEPAPSGSPPPGVPAPTNAPQPIEPGDCDPAYPTVCIPSPPPDLNCGGIPYRDFTVLPADPHGFDGDNDGIGCET